MVFANKKSDVRFLVWVRTELLAGQTFILLGLLKWTKLWRKESDSILAWEIYFVRFTTVVYYVLQSSKTLIPGPFKRAFWWTYRNTNDKNIYFCEVVETTFLVVRYSFPICSGLTWDVTKLDDTVKILKGGIIGLVQLQTYDDGTWDIVYDPIWIWKWFSFVVWLEEFWWERMEWHEQHASRDWWRWKTLCLVNLRQVFINCIRLMEI